MPGDGEAGPRRADGLTPKLGRRAGAPIRGQLGAGHLHLRLGPRNCGNESLAKRCASGCPAGLAVGWVSVVGRSRLAQRHSKIGTMFPLNWLNRSSLEKR